MRNLMLVAAVSLAVLAAGSGTSPLPGQPEKKKDNPKADTVLGFWTEIYYENNGNFFSSISKARVLTEGLGGLGGGIYSPQLWKFSKEKLEMGPDRKDIFPTNTYRYSTERDGQGGTLDLAAMDQKGFAKQLAIYFLKDDILLVCLNGGDGPRPQRFASTEKPRASLFILRRGRLQPEGTWEGRKHRLPE